MFGTLPSHSLRRPSRTVSEGEFSEVRMQDGANPPPLLTLDLRQVASISSDPPRHLALHNKHASQRIRTKGFCMSASTLRMKVTGRLHSIAKPSLLLIVACVLPRAERGNVARSCLYCVAYVTVYALGNDTLTSNILRQPSGFPSAMEP